MLKLSARDLKRMATFKKIGHHIAKLGDPDINDYLTGKASKFKIMNGASDATRSWDSVETAPVIKTPQWLRTVK